MQNSSDNKIQRDFWSGNDGKSYVERNDSLELANKVYKERTGITHQEVFQEFFENLDRNTSILELGCNIGINLEILQNMGFKKLTGLEINQKTMNIAKEKYPMIKFIHSSIEDFKCNDNEYDLVFTTGVLVHINPSNINDIVNKMIRLTKKFIFGFEYFSEKLTEVKYRDHSNLLWKQNFPLLFTKNMKLIKDKKMYWKSENLCDVAYIFEKAE